MRFLFVVLMAFLLWNCETAFVHKDNKDIENRVWMADSILSFGININDTTSAHRINLTVRNTSDYPFYNLYLIYYLKDSLGDLISTDLVNLHLFDPKTGRPLGSGVTGLFSHTFPFIENVGFERPGGYDLEIEQNMRLDSLPGIVSVGIEVIK